MSTITRYSQTHLNRPESVLEHSGFVSLLAYYIGNKLIDDGIKVDIGLLLSKAITHDIDEIVTGDIPRPTKYYNEGVLEAIQKIEKENMGRIAECVNLDEMYVDWLHAKSNDKEGNIIALCDCIAVVYKIWYEVVMLGNKTICDHANGISESLENSYTRLEKYFGYNELLHSITWDAKMMALQIIKTGENKCK